MTITFKTRYSKFGTKFQVFVDGKLHASFRTYNEAQSLMLALQGAQK